MSEPMLPVSGPSTPTPVPPTTTPQATPIATVTGRVTCRLEEELGDQRSNHVTYRFLVENGSSAPIDVFVPVVRVVKDVKVKTVTSSAVADAEEQRLRLCEELEELLDKVVFQRSASFRAAWAQNVQSTLKNALTVQTGNLIGDTVLLAVKLGVRGRKFRDSLMRETSAFRFAIRNSQDAIRGFNQWLMTSDLPPDLEFIPAAYDLKVGQLIDVEDRLGSHRVVMATLQPGATFAHTYLLSFPRTWFDARKDQISVEAEYEEPPGTLRRVNATQSLLISPRPWFMSLIAVTGSVLGVLTYLFLAAKKAGRSPYVGDFFSEAAYDGSFLIAAAIAFVFFNVYEYTRLAKAFGSLRIGWRAAALIGFLCGMAYDRILNALTALIG